LLSQEACSGAYSPAAHHADPRAEPRCCARSISVTRGRWPIVRPVSHTPAVAATGLRQCARPQGCRVARLPGAGLHGMAPPGRRAAGLPAHVRPCIHACVPGASQHASAGRFRPTASARSLHLLLHAHVVRHPLLNNNAEALGVLRTEDRRCAQLQLWVCAESDMSTSLLHIIPSRPSTSRRHAGPWAGCR